MGNAKPRILVPFDFSEPAGQALAWAVDLQQAIGTGPIAIVHAIDCLPTATPDASVAVVLPSEDEIANLERLMLEAAKRCGGTASATVLIKPRPVGEIILDAAREQGAELIVMGTHGYRGVKRLFLGSVADHVVRNAECPVVTVRRSGKDRESEARLPPAGA